MEIEQLEILDFLHSCPPLDKLDKEALEELTNSLEISYSRHGAEILNPGRKNDWLYLIRTGAVEIHDQNGLLHNNIGERSWLGYRCLLKDGITTMSARALEDTLLYMIPSSEFLKLVARHDSVKRYFSDDKTERLRSAINDIHDSGKNFLVSTRVEDLIKDAPIILDHSTPIMDVAKQMTEKSASSMLVTNNDNIEGIVTVTAFCTRFAAEGMNGSDSISRIMTKDPLSISAQRSGSEALLMMSRHHIQHLPVMDNGKPVGILTARELIRQQSHNTIYLTKEIHRSKTIEDLKRLAEQIPDVMVSLVRNSMTAYAIGHAISSIGEAITVKLLKMAEQKLGSPPVEYAWIVAGSLSRDEQTALSDQDNALILSDEYNETEHGEYFEQLSKYVCDGLDTCGYIYCPGEIMAMTPKWRQPLSVWRKYFDSWINTPEPKALMYTSIFFDLRCIYGNKEFLDNLYNEILVKTKGNSIFLSYMAANAQQFHPPLGLFRSWVLEKGGAEKKALNMKKRGVIPVTDLARVYALSANISTLNTQERLEAASEAGALSHSGMMDLCDAFEFISTVRLQHQADQVEKGFKPDNFVSPETLSSLESRHLKDAFDVVRTIQDAMAVRFQTGRLG